MTDSNLDGTPFHDSVLEKEVATNDAVAGETVFDEDGNPGEEPLAGNTVAGEPTYAPNDLADEDIELADQPESR